MPYYYSAFYTIFGVSIQSVLIGQNLLILTSGILVYLCSAVFLSPAMALAAAVSYWCFRGVEFFYTYNHIGGIVGILSVLYFLLRYIKNPKFSYVLLGFAMAFFPLFIRLNIGVSTLVAFVASLLITDYARKDPNASKRRVQYIALSLGILLITFIVYWLLLRPLPAYAIHQSLPYSKLQRMDMSNNIFDTSQTLARIISANFTASWATKIFGMILSLCVIQSVFVLVRGKLPKKYKTDISLVFVSLLIFFVLSLHEYLASGVYYRFSWSVPILIIALFSFLFIGTRNTNSTIIKIFFPIALLLGPTVQTMNYNHVTSLLKTPQTLIQIGENKIYAVQQERWIQTVTSTANYIKAHVPVGEKILALPFDPLYYFLSERDNATREFMFFKHRNIAEEQERKTIEDIEKNNVNYIILSNTSHSPEEGLGTFGETYCKILAKHIFDNYEIEKEIGNWDMPPGWSWNHSVRIYKRK